MRTALVKRFSVLALLGLVATALVFPTAPASAGPRWEEKRRRCFQPRVANHTVRTHCFTLLKLRDDGNGDRDFWTLHHWGTARSKEGYAMKIFRLRVYPHENSPRIYNWSDWDPRGDEDRGGCEQISVGISYIASVSWTHSICEEWDITFFQRTPGKFQNIWRPATKWVEDSEREVAYAIAVAVAQGKRPSWHFRGYAEAH